MSVASSPWLAPLALGALAGLVLATRPGRRAFRAARGAALALAHSRLAPLWVFLAQLALSVGLAALLRLPVPRVHDEFSYLLQADTFAHGRLANPTPPAWEHFETFHVLVRPTYASKYPPAQGLALALGDALWRPILGAWLAGALAAAAVFWMLCAAVPRGWALAGTLLVSTNPQVLEWSWSFWGGAVALAGGATLLGGMLRARGAPGAGPGLALGCGAGVLALSRPFEGCVLTLLALAWLGLAWMRRRVTPRRALATLAASALPVLCALSFQAAYDRAVTGDALTLPYAEYERQYSRAPLFLFLEQDPAPLEHRHAELAEFARIQEGSHAFQRTRSGFWYALKTKLREHRPLAWHGLVFAFGLVALPWLARSALAWGAALVVLAFGCVVLLLPTFCIPHYSAPALPLLALLFSLALRRVAAWRPGGRALGRLAARAALVALSGGALVAFAGPRLRSRPVAGWQHDRAALERELSARPGKHLVLVRYAPGHQTHAEWVYNRADLGAERVIWARDMGEAANARLLASFADRQLFAITVQ